MHDRQSVSTSSRGDLLSASLLRQTCLALWLLACAPVLGAGCASGHTTLVVYAASSLTEAFTAIGAEFEERHAGVRVTFNFAGSQALATQIEHGAGADLFASADAVDMDRLQENGLLAADPVVFSENRLVVAVPAANPAELSNLLDLARPGVRIIVGQENVPIGRFTRQVLANLSADAAYGSAFQEAVLANVRSEELNVRQVLAKVALGEADAGFVYVSDVSGSSATVKTLEIPEHANVTAEYPIALLASAKEEALARRFMEFLRSEIARDILRQAGLQPESSL